jgi:peptidoglycan glycosyltransferase
MAIYSIKDPLRDGPAWERHVLGIWVGTIIMGIVAALPAYPGSVQRGLRSLLPARSILNRYTYIYAMAGILLVVLLWKFGALAHGARLSLGFFQPVEVVKALLVLFVGSYLAGRGGLIREASQRWKPKKLADTAQKWQGISLPRKADIAPLLVMFLLCIGLFLVVKDHGPAVALFSACAIWLYIASGRSGVLWLAFSLLLAGGWFAYLMHVGVAPVRIDMWRSPWQNSHPNGMQLGQALWGMASGGVQGSGLGLGMPSSTPRAGSDLVFATIAEELGVLGALLILVLFSVFIARGLRAALRAGTELDRMLATGIACLFGCQAVCQIAGVTGLLPLTGITAPFVSYGNSSLIVSFALAGLLYGISAGASTKEPTIAHPAFGVAASRTSAGFACVLLLVLGLGRVAYVQGIAANDIATLSIRTPDADGDRRAKRNPRLMAMERGIVRGTIFDRNGEILATSKRGQTQTAGTNRTGRERVYPQGDLTSHLVGYVRPSLGGPAGWEKEFQGFLRGYENDAELLDHYRCKDLPRLLTRLDPLIGKDVKVALDVRIQKAAREALERTLQRQRPNRSGGASAAGSMIVLDPTNGDLLAAVALPVVDPNTLSGEEWQAALADKRAPLLDRSRMGLYPPGSVIKIATASAALEQGIDPTFNCAHTLSQVRWTTGGKTYSRKKLVDDLHDPPHGRIRLARAMQVSCNVYFAQLGMKLGPKAIRETFADRFGFSRTPSQELIGEDLPDVAYGQGRMLVTPLEIATLSATVANGGQRMKPRYWMEVREPGNHLFRTNEPEPNGRPIGPMNAQRLGEMMRGVVNGGTARGVFDSLPVQVAGKTGTAEVDRGKPHSWFAAYAPYSKPQYAISCIIENGGYGRSVAAPCVAEALKAILER